MTLERLLVEEEEAYRFWMKDHKVGEKIWYTHTPWLLEKLPMMKQQVVSLESFVSQKEINELGVFCIHLSLDLADLLVKCIGDHSLTPHVKVSFLYYLRRTLFPLIYKSVILNRWIGYVSEQGTKNVIIGVKKRLHNKKKVDFDRFDNLYAQIGKCIDLSSDFDVVEIESGIDDKDTRLRMMRVGRSGREKLLSLVNANLPILVHRFWKRLLHSRKIKLPFTKKNGISILIIDECELLEETFLFLLLGGGSVSKLKGLNDEGWEKQCDIQRELSYDRLADLFYCCLNRYSNVKDWIKARMLNALAILFHPMLIQKMNQVLNVVSWLEGNSAEMKMVKELARERSLCVVTSGISHVDRMVICGFLREMGVPVFTFEHGLTYGLSMMTEYWGDRDSMCVGSGRISYTPIAEKFHQKCCNGVGKGVVSGMPKINERVRWKFIQKAIGNRILKFPDKRRTVVYIANLYFNNFIYSPGCCSDTWYHQFKRKVVFEILGESDYNCIIKLYPTFRYRDPDPFGRLITLPSNVKAVQFIEFRYLRAIGDIMICDSPQSTLGWVWSARVPVIYLDLPSNPLLPHVAKAFDDAIFRIDCSKLDWVEKARYLLTLPYGKLLSKWKEKETMRERVEKEYIIGPPGNAGMRAAKFIFQETARLYRCNEN